MRDTINQVYDAIRTAVDVREGVESATDRADEMEVGDRVRPLADSIADGLTAVQETLMQTKNRSGQDPIRFPPMLDNQLVALYEYVTAADNYRFGGAEGRPTEGAITLFDDLTVKWMGVSMRLQSILQNDVTRLNQLLEALGVPGVVTRGRRELIP